VIAKVGPGGNYLMETHTLKRCRTEFWQPEVFSREGLENWMTAGRPEIVSHARQRWEALVAEHEDPPMDSKTADQLQSYVDEQTS
jgi:trimethylamine--corrinoid protein Co-methyltransferase